MSHLYYDLEHSSNADMLSDTKIDICINHYILVRNMPSYARLDIYVKLEIKRFLGKSTNNANGALQRLTNSMLLNSGLKGGEKTQPGFLAHFLIYDKMEVKIKLCVVNQLGFIWLMC